MKRAQGWSLLELMLFLALVSAVLVVVYQTFQPAQLRAAVRQEQQSVGQLVDGIVSAYTTFSDFSTLSTQTVAGALNIPLQSNGTLNSALKRDVSVRPATTYASNDSFDIVYANLTPNECMALVPALAARATAAFIGEGTSVSTATGVIANENEVSVQCTSRPSASVAFRFGAQKRAFAAEQLQSCMCAPEHQTQSLACASGFNGSITQRRTGVCNGGTPSCPTLEWNSWATVANTCSQNAAPDPTAPIAPSLVNSCVPATRVQTASCPAGFVGTVVQRQTLSCPSQTWSAWSTVSTSCQSVSTTPPCTPATQRQTVACPIGQGGETVQERASVCAPNGSETWGSWNTVSSTCTASCTVNGTCCRNLRESETRRMFCPTGTYGTQQGDYMRSSLCPTPTAPSGGQWQEWSIQGVIRGSCTTCTPITQQETRAIPSSAACPSGQSGFHTWTSEQSRRRTGNYDCRQGSNSELPAPIWTEWSAWQEDRRSNESNTCSSGPYATPHSGGYVMWTNSDWSGQESSPCRPDDMTYNDVNILISKSVCDRANFGNEAGGTWCEPGGPNIVGGLSAVCMYEATVSSTGTTATLFGSTTTDFLIPRANASCLEGLPAYSFDRSITYQGTTYRVAGSCPGKTILGARTSNPFWRCTLTHVSPTPLSTYEVASYSQYIGDIGVLWNVPALNPTAQQHVMNFVIRADRSTTACSRSALTAISPLIFNDQRVISVFGHRELQNY